MNAKKRLKQAMRNLEEQINAPPRNLLILAMHQSRKGGKMKHRAEARGGNRNTMNDYISEGY